MNDVVKREEEAPPPVSDTAAIIHVIERAARDPNVDVDKLERLMAMRERMEDRHAEQAFNEAMQAAKAEMPQVLRDAKNETTHSTYSRLETVAKAVDPVITKHGFVPSFGTDVSPMEGHYRVTCALSHVAGHTRHYHADIPADLTGMKGNPNKTPTHAFGSTLSYGRRYLKLLIFDIATTDDDDGNKASTGELISDEQYQWLRALADEVEADIPAFCRWANIKSLPEMPAKDFEKAKRALEQKRAKTAQEPA